MMADNTKLKPCPFCGNHELEIVDDRLGWFVRCNDCAPFPTVIYGERVPELGEDHAESLFDWDAVKLSSIEAWNTRVTMDKADMARTLQQLIQTEGLDAAYVWLGEVATGEEPEFSRPGDVVHDL